MSGIRTVVATILWVGLAVFPAEGGEPLNSFAAAQELFLRGLDGDKEACKEAAQRFESLLAEDPKNPLILAYLGSTETLRAKHGWMPWSKIYHAKKGLALLDQSLAALAPEHGGASGLVGMEVRLVAGRTFAAVPRFFNRFDRGKALLDGLAADPGLQQAPDSFGASVHVAAAKAAKSDGDEGRAKELLTRATALDPRGPEGHKARELLAGM
jgi:hypothetical protein